jgi:hypothetical protein
VKTSISTASVLLAAIDNAKSGFYSIRPGHPENSKTQLTKLKQIPINKFQNSKLGHALKMGVSLVANNTDASSREYLR